MSFGLGHSSSTTPAGFGSAALTTTAAVDSSTPWIAAADGDLPLLQQALAKLNLPIHAADSQGYTLLQAAASYGQIHVLQWIVATNQPHGLNVNAVDLDGDSALHYASTVAAAQFLVETAGINTNITNKVGLDALTGKKQDLQAIQEDEDADEDDVDAVNLKEVVEYLQSLATRQQ